MGSWSGDRVLTAHRWSNSTTSMVSAKRTDLQVGPAGGAWLRRAKLWLYSNRARTVFSRTEAGKRATRGGRAPCPFRKIISSTPRLAAR